MKKQKKKRILTRRQSALKAAAVTLAVILFVNHVMHLGQIFPIQTVWQLEERAGISHTRVVDRSRTPEIQRTNIAFLTANDKATMFSSCYLTIYGWMANFHVALDCTGEEPLYTGASYMSKDENQVWYFFGCVDDPKIQRVEISLCETVYDINSIADAGDEVHRMAGIPLDEQSGRRYFLVKYTEGWNYDAHSRPCPVVIGYDEGGKELVRTKIEQWNRSSFG